MPDKLAPDAVASLPEIDTDGTHLLGDEFPYHGEPFRFPFTAHA
jgi:hypothetical protein